MFETVLIFAFSTLASSGLITLIFRLWIQKKLDQSLKLFQHELDKKKDVLQIELAVYAEHAKLRLTNHREKSILALESIYAAFVMTSLPRQQFRCATDLLKNPNTSVNDSNSEYFRLFSENFQAFSRAFQAVTEGFRCVEENAIYLDGNLESEVLNALNNVNFCYQRWHGVLKSAHSTEQSLFAKGSLNGQTRSLNFDEFFAALRNDWVSITGAVTSHLKARVRELLTP